MQRRRADDFAVDADQIDHREVARLVDAGRAVDHRAQGLRHRRAGVEEIDVDAARAVVTGRLRLHDAPVLARPADPPRVHLADGVGSLLAQQPRQGLGAQPAPGGERVGIMMAPVVGSFRAERRGDRHLRHHRRAAAADETAVDQQHPAAPARRLDRRIHAGPARADDEDVG
jgi:hypothetical protein